MDRTQFHKPPRWWGPRLNPWMIRLLSPLRRRMQRRAQGPIDGKSRSRDAGGELTRLLEQRVQWLLDEAS
jgi:hypothetical protein